VKARPNPWIALPALLLGALIGYIAWVVTDTACRLEGTTTFDAGCPISATVISLASFAAATIGLAIVLSLVFRSVAEYRDRDRPG
jgi:hypothetical protein